MVLGGPSVCLRFAPAAFGRRFYNGYADRRSKVKQRLFQRRVEFPIRKTIFELNSARLPHQYAGQVPGAPVYFEEDLEKIAFRRFTRAQALRSAGVAFPPWDATQNSVPCRPVSIVGEDFNSSAEPRAIGLTGEKGQWGTPLRALLHSCSRDGALGRDINPHEHPSRK